MSPVLLLGELRNFIEGVVKEYSLETGKGIKKEPQVLEGYLPPKQSTETPDIPYVIVRLVEGVDDQHSGQVVVKILVGTHSEDIDGWKDAVNIMMRIRERLFETRTLARKYRVEHPLKWKLFENQPYPEWIGEILTIWTIARPIEVFEEGGHGY